MAIKLDGAILVDAGAQWNTSQVWSADLTTTSNFIGNVSQGFDGDPATDVTYGGDAASGSITYGGTLTGVTSLKIQCRDNTRPSNYRFADFRHRHYDYNNY